MNAVSLDVPFRVWERFAPKIARIEKFAAKLGTAFRCTVGAPFGRDTGKLAPDGSPVIREYVHVELEAEVPVISGWTLAAAIDHTTDGNLLRVSPRFATALPLSYRSDKPTCDHCGCERRRLVTYALHNGAEFKRVGSSCLVDFLGHGDAVALVEFAATIADITAGLSAGADDSEPEEGGGSGRAYYLTEGWIALAFRTIAATGAYVSGRAARDADMVGKYLESTVARMYRHLRPNRLYPARDRLPDVTADEEAQFAADARAAIAWVRESVGARSAEDRSDFDHNLFVIAGAECVGEKHTGIAAYIAEAYRRHLGTVAAAAARAARGASEWLGAAGDKVEFVFVLEVTRSQDTDFGTVYYHRGLANGKDTVTIKASNADLPGLKRGEYHAAAPGARFAVKATVKKAGEFRGVKDTLVTRARVAPVAE